MTAEYSVEVCKQLAKKVENAQLYRPQRAARYDPGDELVYDVTEVAGANQGLVRLVVEKFVGGGFAGQVYRVKVTEIQTEAGKINGLKIGGTYAMKILVPPTGFANLFRSALYWIGFQGPFQLQVNPVASRAGALWQKFVRRAAKIRFGDENAIADVHATFVDSRLGSCGEISQWIEGRTWRLEVDDRLDLLEQWRSGKKIEGNEPGSPEYRAKRRFMADFVKLLGDMGAYEFARQYEWSTCKSQPNCLKLKDTENDPSAGLVAVDFRAGLALLPFLPMSPGDFKLIVKGLMRGSIVQFDRGDPGKLEAFVNAHRDEFADMGRMLDELKAAEKVYRDSVPDITHNHIRLFYDGKLWSTILDSAVTGWKVRDNIDDVWERKLRNSAALTILFFVIGIVPFLGRVVRRVWAHRDWRKHYGVMLLSWGYLYRAIQARIAEKAISWHRAGRVTAERALKITESIGLFFCHLPFSVLPAWLHRFLTDRNFRREKLVYIFVRPVRLYFNTDLREQWLREMVTEGQKKHMLTDEDADVILSQVNEPFIQKYLKSLAVHICTLPVTQLVSVAIAVIYVLAHPELPWKQSWGTGALIIGAFQVTPISPGSLVRGFYVLYLVIKERNFRDYNIAVFLGFFKYIGYLAFPIQMTYHYPALARFMAAHWATGAAHLVPVFGERGALLEHGVFCLFYNRPLTIRRRMRKRAKMRAAMKPRYRHVGLCAVAAAIIFGFVDFIYLKYAGYLPSLRLIWPIAVAIPLLCGGAVTVGAGGAALGRRIIAAAVAGVLAGVLYTVISAMLGAGEAILTGCLRRVFVFTIFSVIGAVLTELKLPEPTPE